MTPKRIQRKRTKGWRMPEGAVFVGRPSRWGNPYQLGRLYMTSPILTVPMPTWRGPGDYEHGLHVERLTDRALAVRWFLRWWNSSDQIDRYVSLQPLKGKDLACWCPLDQPCHADILLALANSV